MNGKPSTRSVTSLVWIVLEPVGLYYVFYNLFYHIAYFFLGAYVSYLFCLGIAAAATLPIIFNRYRKTDLIRPAKGIGPNMLFYEIGYVVAIVLLGCGLNVLLTQLSTSWTSEAFDASSQVLTSGSLATKLVVTCLLTPLLEELTYRGLVCGRLMICTKNHWAILVSALAFGLMHTNIVQFSYAVVMGLFLGYAYSKTHKLWIPFAAHALTNLVVVMYAYIPSFL